MVVPVVESLTLVPSNQICTVGNEIMDKNTKQSEAVKVRKAEGEGRRRNKSSLVEYDKKDGEIIVGKFARFLGGVVMIGVHIATITRLKSIFFIFIQN